MGWAVPNPDLSVCLFPQRWFWLVRVLLSLFIGAEIVGEYTVQLPGGRSRSREGVAEGTEKWGTSSVSWFPFHFAPISGSLAVVYCGLFVLRLSLACYVV